MYECVHTAIDKNIIMAMQNEIGKKTPLWQQQETLYVKLKSEQKHVQNVYLTHYRHFLLLIFFYCNFSLVTDSAVYGA